MSFYRLLEKPVQLVSEFASSAKHEVRNYVRGHVEDMSCVAVAAPHFAKAAFGGTSVVALSIMDLGAISMTVQASQGRMIPLIAAASLSVAVYDAGRRTRGAWKTAIARMDSQLDQYLENPIKGLDL